MSESELEIYWEHKKQLFTTPKVLSVLAREVNRLCENTKLDFGEQYIAVFIFELLCFTLEIPQGRQMYLRLLNHIAPFRPEIAEKYWRIFDNQENMKKRYNL